MTESLSADTVRSLSPVFGGEDRVRGSSGTPIGPQSLAQPMGQVPGVGLLVTDRPTPAIEGAAGSPGEWVAGAQSS